MLIRGLCIIGIRPSILIWWNILNRLSTGNRRLLTILNRLNIFNRLSTRNRGLLTILNRLSTKNIKRLLKRVR